MIRLNRKEDCCGCGACEQKCPKKCISLQPDIEGFLYPVINATECISCDLCEKVCPVINERHTTSKINTYAAKTLDESLREKSSSGGLFAEIAYHILNIGGVVFGAIFNSDFDVIHTYTRTRDGIIPMLKSKYVQSQIGENYRLAEKFLKQNIVVLFTGTPCQIAGLLNYLGKEYSNLFTVEVICHGVPSPGCWRRYLTELLTKKHEEKLTEISFREKGRYSWTHYGMKISGEKSSFFNDYASNNSFMRAFLSNNCIRPICYECRHKEGSSGADITLGDFWGIERICKKLDDQKGVSLVIINSEKGHELISLINVNKIEVNNHVPYNHNKSYYQSAPKSLKRKRFFYLLNNYSLCFEEVVKKVIPRPSEQTIIQKIFDLPNRIYRYFLRNILNKNI